MKMIALAALIAVLAPSASVQTTSADGDTVQRYLVVFRGTQAADGTFALGGNYALNYGAALAAVQAAGGSVTYDAARQIGVMQVASANPTFAQVLRTAGLVESVGDDFGWRQSLTFEEAVESGELTVVQAPPPGGPGQTQDPLEPEQWDMMQIQAPEAHDVQAGSRFVDVGILDSGVDGQHPDFLVGPGGTNVDCARGRDFVSLGPGVGNPDPCVDNQFHGTHVAGTVAAQANMLGVVGVAPRVTLVPVKVCDTSGYCYASAVVAGITYAGDAKLDVINMSFFVDDNELLQSTEFKCMNVEAQRTFRKAVERAIQYARNQGVTPIAALGNSDNDLAHPPEPYENQCDVVPAETQGVVGTSALGRLSEKASYSNYGVGMNDVSAPGGNGTTGDCETTILSTLPGGIYGCIQGTSMASPHTAGVAALIISQFGTLRPDGDVHMPPQAVENYLQSTVVDIGLPGYDKCYGHGRINALRAVLHQTSNLYDPSAPACPEYQE